MQKSTDTILPFQLEHSPVRGRITLLDQVVRDIIRQHNYPRLVNRYLSEAIALSVAVSNCFKFDGFFTLQITGNEAVSMMVVDVTSDGNIRACARFDAKKIEKLEGQDFVTVPQLFGSGYLAFTIDQENSKDRYQGLVELEGATLTDCMHHFFRQSEQLDTGIVVYSDMHMNLEKNGPLAGALMVQRLPIEDRLEKESDTDMWIKTLSVIGTIRPKELLDPKLNPSDLLYRLFWEDGVRGYPEKQIKASCRCSQTKVMSMLTTFSKEDLQHMLVDDEIVVTCEFCNTSHAFSKKDIGL